jgi:hypothetical protein
MSKFVRQPPTSPSGVTWIAGGEVDEYHISLGFYGDDLDPDEISTRLAGSPTSMCRKGDPIAEKDNPHVERTGRWVKSSDTLPGESLEPQLNQFLASLTQDVSIWRSITKQYKTRFIVSATIRNWNRGLDISPELLRQIADRGLGLGVDIYVDYKGHDV